MPGSGTSHYNKQKDKPQRWRRGGTGEEGDPVLHEEEVIREDEEANQLQQLLGSSGKDGTFVIYISHSSIDRSGRLSAFIFFVCQKSIFLE